MLISGPVKPMGKQTVKQLVGQNQGVSNIEITDSNIKAFERVARKYGVDYAVKKDHSVSPPKYLVFFKARDTDALTSAFTEFTAKQVQQKSKPSIVAQIRKLADIVRAKSQDKVKNKVNMSAAFYTRRRKRFTVEAEKFDTCGGRIGQCRRRRFIGA
jgi:hypothetical protein